MYVSMYVHVCIYVCLSVSMCVQTTHAHCPSTSVCPHSCHSLYTINLRHVVHFTQLKRRLQYRTSKIVAVFIQAPCHEVVRELEHVDRI